MTYHHQHRQNSFHLHTLVPFASAAELEDGRVVPCAVEAGVSQHDHPVNDALNQVVESGVVNVGGVAVPGCDESESVQDKAEFPSNYSSVVGLSLLAYLCRASAFSHRMYQFDSVSVHDAQQCMGGQEAVCPVLMGVKAAEQTCTLRKTREHINVVGAKPVVEGSAAQAFYGVEQTDCNQFTWVQCRLAVVRRVFIASSILQNSSVIKSVIATGCSSSTSVVQLTEWGITVAFSTLRKTSTNGSMASTGQ